MIEDGIVTEQMMGRETTLVTLTAGGENEHNRWGMDGPRSMGERCSCHERIVRDGIAAWNVSAGSRWNVLRTSLVDNYPGLTFIRSVEVQKRGALHLHIVMSTNAPLDPHLVQRLALLAGFGCSVDVAPIHSHNLDHAGDSRRVGHYLSKYLTKAADARQDAAWEDVDLSTGELVPCKARYRTWSSSRSWGVQMKTVLAAIHRSHVLAAVRLADAPDPPSSSRLLFERQAHALTAPSPEPP